MSCDLTVTHVLDCSPSVPGRCRLSLGPSITRPELAQGASGAVLDNGAAHQHQGTTKDDCGHKPSRGIGMHFEGCIAEKESPHDEDIGKNHKVEANIVEPGTPFRQGVQVGRDDDGHIGGDQKPSKSRAKDSHLRFPDGASPPQGGGLRDSLGRLPD